MTTPSDERRPSPWEEEGRRQALLLDGCSIVLVVGDDPRAAAEVSVGMGRVQARLRRVVVADAVGLLSPLDDLVPFDTPLGIADVLVQGAPLSTVAHRVDAAGTLSVLPSGPRLLDRVQLLRSERWTQLTQEFRDAGALLIVVVPDREPALNALQRLVDGAVLVGRALPLAGIRVLAYVRGPGAIALPTPRSSSSRAEGSTPDMPSPKLPSRPGAIARVTSTRLPRPKARTRRWLVALFAAALLFEAVVWWWNRHNR